MAQICKYYTVELAVNSPVLVFSEFYFVVCVLGRANFPTSLYVFLTMCLQSTNAGNSAWRMLPSPSSALAEEWYRMTDDDAGYNDIGWCWFACYGNI